MFSPSEYEDLRLGFSRGVNSEKASHLLSQEEVYLSKNFEYVNGSAVSRPGLESFRMFDSPGSDGYASGSWSFSPTFETPSYVMINNFVIVGNTFYTVKIESDRIEVRDRTAGVGPLLPIFHESAGSSSYDVVNGFIVVAGFADLIIFDPTAATGGVSLVTGKRWRHLVGHGTGRVVGAFDPLGVAGVGRSTVGWSVAGDAANWVGAGSGSVVLADSGEDITGLANIRDNIVVARPTGFHIGTATGTITPVFQFRRASKQSVGCVWPSTFASDGVRCYFVSSDNVYTFDLVDTVPIGGPLRSLIIKSLSQFKYYGLITRLCQKTPKYQYHLVPTGTVVTHENGPYHFVYDIEYQTWSIHSYNNRFLTCPPLYFQASTKFGPCLAMFTQDSGLYQNLSRWNTGHACEQKLVFKKNVMGVGTRGIKIPRILLRYSMEGHRSKTLTATFTGKLPGGIGTSVTTTTLSKAGTNEPTSYWYTLPQEEWIDSGISGGLTDICMEVEGGSFVAIHDITIPLADLGERGKYA